MFIGDYDYRYLVDYLAELFQAALNTQIHLDSFERNLSHSDFIKELEENQDSFLYRNIDSEKEKILGTKCLEYSWEIRDICYWMAEAYLKIFYEYRRSFEYIFLMLPIKEMIRKFDLYHIEDFGSIVHLFGEIESKSTTLRRLMKREHLTYHKLSELSGVRKNTLIRYAKNDNYLTQGRFDDIMIIARILEVKPNIFSKDIKVHLNRLINMDFECYAEYRLYYYFSILCYFISDFALNEFNFDNEIKCFVNHKKDQKVFIIESEDAFKDAVSHINTESFNHKNTYVLFKVVWCKRALIFE